MSHDTRHLSGSSAGNIEKRINAAATLELAGNIGAAFMTSSAASRYDGLKRPNLALYIFGYHSQRT